MISYFGGREEHARGKLSEAEMIAALKQVEAGMFWSISVFGRFYCGTCPRTRFLANVHSSRPQAHTNWPFFGGFFS
jgi:hypothetical protein